MIWNLFTYQTNNIRIIIPNHEQKNKTVLKITKNKPRYIGFLVIEKIPVVTKVVASYGFIGLTVVLSFLNKKIANIAVTNPTKRNNIRII